MATAATQRGYASAVLLSTALSLVGLASPSAIKAVCDALGCCDAQMKRRQSVVLVEAWALRFLECCVAALLGFTVDDDIESCWCNDDAVWMIESSVGSGVLSILTGKQH